MKDKISKNVYILGFVSFFADISSEMLYPLTPIFLTTVLGAPMAIVGIIEGIAESTASIFKMLSGYWSDRLGKRFPFVISGYSLSAIAKPLVAISQGWVSVLFARFIDRFGKGLRTSARDAILADSSTSQNRGITFGLHRAMDTAGAIVGPLFALGLLGLMGEDYRKVFFIAFIPAFFGVLLLFFVEEKKRDKSEVNSPKLNITQFDRHFKIFLLVSVIFALGNSSDVFLILRAKDLGFSVFLAVLCYVLYNALYAISSAPAGMLSDIISRRKVLIAGFLVFSFVYLGFGLIKNPIFVWLLFGIYGIYMGMTEGISKAFVVDLVPEEKRGTAIGIFYTATGLSTLIASSMAGFMWSYLGVSVPFLYGGVMAILAAILLLLSPKTL